LLANLELAGESFNHAGHRYSNAAREGMKQASVLSTVKLLTRLPVMSAKLWQSWRFWQEEYHEWGALRFNR